MERRRRCAQEQGFILVVLYLFVAALVIFGGALVSFALAEIHAAQRAQASTQALYLAEAGVDSAIVQLRGDSVWLGGSGAEESGTFSVAIESLSSTRVRLTSVGNSDLLSGPVTRTVEAIVDVTPNPLFQFSVFGKQSVTLTGNATTDSYDSSKGSYNAAAAGSEGDVGTNGTGASVISLNGNTKVNGDAFAGVGADPNAAITTIENAVITGDRTTQDDPFVLPSVTIPDGLANSGAVSVSGSKTKTYAGGTYWFTSVSVSGNGKLNFTGPATVYVTGNVSISGNGISTSGNKPPNLVIYVQGDHTVSVGGNGNFYGALYAPDSTVTLAAGNGEFFGAGIGDTVYINGIGHGGMHYDLALRAAVAGAGSTVVLRSWRDLSSENN